MKYFSLHRFISLLAFAPFITFIIAKAFLCKAPDNFCPWSMPFYYAALVAVIVIILHRIFNINFNYFLLATNIWLISSAILFLANQPYLLQLMNNYKGPFLFCAFIFTSVISLIFSYGVFSNASNIGKGENQKLTIIFLAGSTLAFMWSLIFNSSGITLSIVVPFMMLAILYVCLINFHKQINHLIS